MPTSPYNLGYSEGGVTAMTAWTESDSSRLEVLIRRRAAIDVAQIDYRRELNALVTEGYKQTEIARALHISQPAVSKAVKGAAGGAPDPAPGFSGGRAVRDLPALRSWCDQPRSPDLRAHPLGLPPLYRGGEWFEDPIPSPAPGSWREVEDAADDGLIDDEIYETVRQSKAHSRRRGLDVFVNSPVERHIELVRELTRRSGPLDLDAPPTASVNNPEWFDEYGHPVASRCIPLHPVASRRSLHASIVASLLASADSGRGG